MSSDKTSKTEEATPKRKAESRREGQIPKSMELVQWSSLLVAIVLLQRSFAIGSHRMQLLFAAVGDAISHPDQGRMLRIFGQGMLDVGIVVAPLAVGMMLIGLIGNLAQVGFMFTTKPLKPKFSKLNPLPGIKKLFSANSMWEATKSLLKVALLAGLAWKTMSHLAQHLAQGGPFNLTDLTKTVASTALRYVRTAALFGLVIAAVDYALQKRRTRKSMMMSKEEVKQESKMSETSPEVKGAIRQKQRQLSANRMMADIASASAVVVNPIHFAVAIEYNPATGAPRVVAKGSGDVAEKIKEKALEFGVPIVEDIPLARTLHKTCEIGDEIPPQMFEAVAKLLAFIFHLKSRRRLDTSNGIHKPPASLLTGV